MDTPILGPLGRPDLECPIIRTNLFFALHLYSVTSHEASSYSIPRYLQVGESVHIKTGHTSHICLRQQYPDQRGSANCGMRDDRRHNMNHLEITAARV